MKIVARWRRWRYRRKLSAWERGLPERLFVARADDWAREPVGSVVDISSWTMPPRREWPLAYPEDGFGRRRVEPEPRGPRAVRIVSKSPDAALVAYEVVG